MDVIQRRVRGRNSRHRNPKKAGKKKKNPRQKSQAVENTSNFHKRERKTDGERVYEGGPGLQSRVVSEGEGVTTIR